MSTLRTPTTRRSALGLAAATATTAAGAPVAASPAFAADRTPDADVVALEQRYGVRLGLAAANLRTGARLANRAHDRFALCSTGKVLAAAHLLHRGTDLDRSVRIRPGAVVDNSPVTSQRGRMTWAELCDAALRYSDNTAMNLLLDELGGPARVTAFVRRTGDRVTRLDRYETALNSAIPGDPRDTTTRGAIAATYRTLLLGRELPSDRRLLLRAWMTGNTTSIAKFRAGLPTGWWFADKTGSGSYGSSNDVGLVTAPDGTELLVAVMARDALDRPEATTDPQLFVDTARLLVDRLG